MSLLSRLAVQAARAYGILSSKSTNVSASYLVVAGGGSGSTSIGFTEASGGGGAGGYLTSTFTLSTLNTYTVTVGAGGAGSGSYAGGNNGSNSVLSGTGITTITSTGGGRGNADGPGENGGSGGGGGAAVTSRAGGTGTAGQGNNGGSGFGSGTNSLRSGGGGGGSGAVGANATSGQGGTGGAGTASSITGTSVTYAAGGGGSSQSAGGSGGSSIGGNGQGLSPATSTTSGTANRGAGGGGSINGTSGSGGSGIVIISYASATPKFIGGTLTTSGGNQIHTFTSSGTLSPITPVSASYLVVAGGGGGGDGGGGGGAGGLLTSSTTLYSGATYIVTVGGGGAGGTSGNGTQGGNSVLSGTGLTTLTATGGGYGGGNNTNAPGGSGGSGGGGGFSGVYNQAGGTNTSGQGFAGGANIITGNLGAGGGGGSSAVGVAATSGVGGNGGAGTASSISGSSVTYAGGGGGGGTTGYTAGTGGAGGGGNGVLGTSTGVSGTTNTGGGGGGGGFNNVASFGDGGAGGSGIVIISYAGSQVFNGGLVTSSGGNTIHTFTSTGALTPLTNNLNNSLRFRSSASAYLNRTPSGSSGKIWTWSAWIKRGSLSGVNAVFSAYSGGINTNSVVFFNDTLNFSNGSALSPAGSLFTSTAVFRDPSAWYHLVVTLDVTQTGLSSQLKFYINGNQLAGTYGGTAFSNIAYPIGNNFVNRIGANGDSIGAIQHFDGYMEDINFIDGQALEPYYFGNNDANGVWKPILYKGTYGTNGFYLTFGNTTSTTTLGYDSSPNGNNWTCNNISLTAGVTYDAMTDVPTNTSATVANYCVMNPISGSASGLSNGNLTISNAAVYRLYGTFGMSSGKWYWESLVSSIGSGTVIGISSNPSQAASDSNRQGYYSVDGRLYNDAGNTAYGNTYTTNDIIGIAYDADSGKLYFSKNNTWQNSGNPATGTNPAISSLTGTWFPFQTTDSCSLNLNFGQRPFSYTPPTGFVALNTFNLPTPTILQGNKYMDATLWTGTGTTQVIVNQALFQPDFVWVKGRSGATDHALYDAVRGVQKQLESNTTTAETTETTGLTAFNSNGFTVGALAQLNTSAATYVGWQWQANGAGSSNTSGSITSTVSVSTTAGFSIVTYTGTGANATVGHGLGVAPAMVIVKRRSGAEAWGVYHKSLGATQAINLELTVAAYTYAIAWNNTAPTSSTFSLGTWAAVNSSSGTFVAYCWAEIAGFSKFGSYTGNGSADGPFVYLGFRPKWILIKGSSFVDNWALFDTSMSPFNIVDTGLLANTSGSAFSAGLLDVVSNGFKIRANNTTINTSSGTIIYAAFAENPFKNSNAR